MKNWFLIVLKRSDAGIDMQWINISWQSVNQSLIKITWGLNDFIRISFGDSYQWFGGSISFKSKAAHSSDYDWHIIHKRQLLFSLIVFEIRIYSNNAKCVFSLIDHVNYLLFVNILFSREQFGFYEFKSLLGVKNLERTKFWEVGIGHKWTY